MSSEEVKWKTLMRLYDYFHLVKELPPMTFDAAVNKLLSIAEGNVRFAVVKKAKRP